MFVEEPVRIASPIGDLELGVVDAHAPEVAEGISRLLMRSIQDARAENGGHLPSWLVDDIEQNYISPHRVRTLWARTGHRFVLRRPSVAGGEILGTIHIAKSESMILTVDRTIINVEESAYPGFKPPRHHHVVNISVLHELRRARLGTLMMDGIVRHFRHLFSGVGLWVRADPPWHPGLSGLGFVHDTALDVFLPEAVERTAGLPHRELNQRYACACGPRRPEMDTHKLQYVSMTRLFEPAIASARVVHPPVLVRETLQDAGPQSSIANVVRPTSVDETAEILAWASHEGRRVTIRGQGQSYDAEALGDDVVLSTERLTGIVSVDGDRVTIRGGTTWRALLTELTAENARTGDVRYPPVVPSWIESSVGGALASGTGGIGKGSLRHGTVSDHVESLLVITGDGRRVVCSATQARWLFEAVLAGAGRFGVIAEATLRLASRPRLVARSSREVSAEGVAEAFRDPALEHASAALHEDRYRVLLTHPAEHHGADVQTIAEHLLPPKAELRPASFTVRAQLTDAEHLARFLESARSSGRHRAPATLRVHPVRERSNRPGLLLSQSDVPDGSVVYIVQALAPAEPRPADRSSSKTSWQALAGARAERARAAKRLADPQAILGSSRLLVV